VAPFPRPTELRGRYVHIVPIDPIRHAAELFPAIGGDEHAGLWTYLFAGPFRDEQEFRDHLTERVASKDTVSYTIVDAESATAVGMYTLMRIEPKHRVIEIGGIILGPKLQRTRGATEAFYLLASYVFDDLRYRRFEWKCHTMNEPSRRAALRFGFSFEGIFRQHMIIKGHSRDTAWYAMIDRDWPSRKAEFERWLAPSNFSADGVQLTPLAMPDPSK
jgi:RimJ/RimL family protein N-acetyltransferase